MKKNSIKTKMKQGIPCLGVFARMDTASVEILGLTGWDFVILDAEHGSLSVSDLYHMNMAAASVGLTSIVRVSSPDPREISRVLDGGADGVQVPQLTTVEEAQACAAATRYSPQGSRGAGAYSRSDGYSTIPFTEHTAFSNQEVLTVLHVENVEMAENIDAMLDVPQLDVVFCGPWDLSQSMGITGQTHHPLLLELMEKVFRRCQQRGVLCGVFVLDPQDISYWRERGVLYFACNTDTGLLAKASSTYVDELKMQLTK